LTKLRQVKYPFLLQARFRIYSVQFLLDIRSKLLYVTLDCCFGVADVATNVPIAKHGYEIPYCRAFP
jgi:hypothetical protein